MKPVRRVPILHGKERRQPKNVVHARRQLQHEEHGRSCEESGHVHCPDSTN